MAWKSLKALLRRLDSKACMLECGCVHTRACEERTYDKIRTSQK